MKKVVGLINGRHDLCQFLIGNVRPADAKSAETGKGNRHTCQFLIGNVRPLKKKVIEFQSF